MVVYTSLAPLTDDTQEALRIFLAHLRDAGLSPVVAETYRTPERQHDLYTYSKSHNVQITKTPTGWHTVGRAADINISPATIANILYFLTTAQSLGFHVLPDVAAVEGLVASGAGDAEIDKHLWDWHHLEYRNGRTRNQAAREYAELGRRPETGIAFSPLVTAAAVVGAFLSFGNGKR